MNTHWRLWLRISVMQIRHNSTRSPHSLRAYVEMNVWTWWEREKKHENQRLFKYVDNNSFIHYRNINANRIIISSITRPSVCKSIWNVLRICYATKIPFHSIIACEWPLHSAQMQPHMHFQRTLHHKLLIAYVTLMWRQSDTMLSTVRLQMCFLQKFLSTFIAFEILFVPMYLCVAFQAVFGSEK